MQDRRDAEHEGLRRRVIQDRRKQEKRFAGHVNAGHGGSRTEGMQGRKDAGKEGSGSGWIKERRDA